MKYARLLVLAMVGVICSACHRTQPREIVMVVGSDSGSDAPYWILIERLSVKENKGSAVAVYNSVRVGSGGSRFMTGVEQLHLGQFEAQWSKLTSAGLADHKQLSLGKTQNGADWLIITGPRTDAGLAVRDVSDYWFARSSFAQQFQPLPQPSPELARLLQVWKDLYRGLHPANIRPMTDAEMHALDESCGAEWPVKYRMTVVDALGDRHKHDCNSVFNGTRGSSRWW